MRRRTVLSWVLGYYVLEMPREACETFMNMCMRYGFEHYGIEFDDERGKVYFTMPSSGRGKVLAACRVWRISVRVRQRRGLLALLSKYRGRWGILIGLVFSLALFVASQSVIWRIDVTGNEALSRESVIECLRENGMKIGDVISRVDANAVEQRVMINNDKISYVSINIIGTVASVEIRETIDTEISDEEKRPANLVSRFDAQIILVEAYTGFICVKEEDFVRAGELLVSGIYKTEKAPIRYTRASGKVFGRVNASFEVEIPLLQVEKVPTGEKIEKKTLIFFGNSIKLFINYRNLPSSCDIMNYEYALDPFSLGELPISIRVEQYLPYEMCEVTLSESEAIEQAYEELRARIDAQLPEAQILKKTLYGEFKDGKYILHCDLTAICNIAKQVEFELIS